MTKPHRLPSPYPPSATPWPHSRLHQPDTATKPWPTRPWPIGERMPLRGDEVSHADDDVVDVARSDGEAAVDDDYSPLNGRSAPSSRKKLDHVDKSK